jgi:glucoamylase
MGLVATRPVEGDLAPGAPGIDPTWAPGAKQAVGTSADGRSRVWFTVAEGIVTEVYYPRVDVANTRDLQLLIAGGGRVWEERRDLTHEISRPDPRALVCDVRGQDPDGAFAVGKRILSDPERPTVLARYRFEALRPEAAEHRLFVLLAPHMEGRGRHNHARIVRHRGRTFLTAWRHDTYLALACSEEFAAASCGFVGSSDGWQDIAAHGHLTARYTAALDGNVAICAEVAAQPGRAFTIAVGFGPDEGQACAAAAESLAAPFDLVERRYREGWHAYCAGLDDLSAESEDGGDLYYQSAMVLKAHEDKANPGAHIASLGIPWGEASGDTNAGGYHLVWPRDLYHTATGRLAAGDREGARAAMRYLERTQREDGSWPQNFWVYGEPYWRGLQLDEIAFPVLLAWQLEKAGVYQHNPYPALVRPAAYAIARIGPVTPQDRWEEQSGYSPSTLAAAIAALVCAAEFARADDDPAAERYFLDTADYWASRLEDWTYTTAGALPGFAEYYERIAPSLGDGDGLAGDGAGEPGPIRRALVLANQPAGAPEVGEDTVIDGGFLELVRYGVRAPADPRITATLSAYDACCRAETPRGPAWYRYTHDGYGEKDDGGPYDGSGVGRPWPLLTGERAHFELAAGHEPSPLIRALEAFAQPCGLLPEQVWDREDLPERGLVRGGPTGAARPLCWAHAEYIKLLRSRRDARVFDCPEPVWDRYIRRGVRSALTVWKFNHKVRTAPASGRLRIEVYEPAALHWSADGWRKVRHDPCEPVGHGVWAYEFPPGVLRRGRTVTFTFYWPQENRWEGQDFVVSMH